MWSRCHQYCRTVSMLPGNFSPGQWCSPRMVRVLAWLIMTPTRQHGQKDPVWGLREGEESQTDIHYAMSFAPRTSRAVSNQYSDIVFSPHADQTPEPLPAAISPMFGQSCLSCQGAGHKNASYNFFCEGLCLLRSLKYLKMDVLPLPMQRLVLLPWISPATTLLFLLDSLDYSITWVQATIPTELGAWCFTEQERWLFRNASKIPWHMKRKMSVYEPFQQLFPNWNGNSETRIVYVKPEDKISSAKGIPVMAQSSRRKQTNPECRYPFFRSLSYWEEPSMNISVDTLF